MLKVMSRMTPTSEPTIAGAKTSAMKDAVLWIRMRSMGHTEREWGRDMLCVRSHGQVWSGRN